MNGYLAAASISGFNAAAAAAAGLRPRRFIPRRLHVHRDAIGKRNRHRLKKNLNFPLGKGVIFLCFQVCQSVRRVDGTILKSQPKLVNRQTKSFAQLSALPIVSLLHLQFFQDGIGTSIFLWIIDIQKRSNPLRMQRCRTRTSTLSRKTLSWFRETRLSENEVSAVQNEKDPVTVEDDCVQGVTVVSDSCA